MPVPEILKDAPWRDRLGRLSSAQAHRAPPRRQRGTFGCVRNLAALAILLPLSSVLAACAGPTYLSAQPLPAEHTITVGGSATLDVVPDEACVELTLAARDPAMPAAHAALVASTTALLADLHQRPALVVEQGATTYSPEYDNDGSGHSRLARYVASMQINTRTRDFTQIPDAIGRASARGLDRVNVVYYSTQIVGKKAEVRTHALEAAHEKAIAMTRTLGVALGDVVTIVEGDTRTNASVNVSNYLERGTVDRASDVPAPPGSIPLSVTVSVVYGLR
jgi:uncharacterized protein YggE